MMRLYLRLSAVAILAVLILALSVPARAQLSGAIFTTDVNGSEVNANIYPSKDAVYLTGGPPRGAPQTAAGLPDGTYVFQVTDPSGKHLLSTDPAKCRQFTVANGIITGVVNVGGCQHATGTDLDEPGAVTVQLIPYLNTPNNGGEYKAWATPVANYLDGCNTLGVSDGLDTVDCGDTGGDVHGFIPSHSKTDNFKVNSITPREIDTHFGDSSNNQIAGICETWIDTLGVNNPRCTEFFSGVPLSHVESPENGVHQIVIYNQPGCTVTQVTLFSPNKPTQYFTITGTQTIVDVNVPQSVKTGQWTIYVTCI